MKQGFLLAGAIAIASAGAAYAKPPHAKAHKGKPTHVVQDHRGHVGYGTGGCPPGLAKKNNGCMPPGQAKKWRVGHALPREVIYYDLPPALVVQIGMPPAGYKYVRVAADILMIAVGTGMVVSAIEDLGRM